MIYRHCRSSKTLMTHHPLTKWKWQFSVSKITKQPVLTTYLLKSLSMVDVLNTEGCIILSLTAGPLSISHSNGKMPTSFLYISKRVTEQNVASPFYLCQAKCWLKSCSPVFSSTWSTLSCLNLNAGYGADAAKLTGYLLPGNCKKNVVNSVKTYACPSLI